MIVRKEFSIMVTFLTVSRSVMCITGGSLAEWIPFLPEMARDSAARRAS